MIKIAKGGVFMFSRNDKIIWMSINDLFANPLQPRRQFDEIELISLAESIRQNGILQPLTIRSKNGRYELIAGERRLRAAKLAGLTKVPCITVDATERQSALFALIENIQRQDLNFFEEAEGISRLMKEWSMTQEDAAIKLGKAQSTLANKMRLLRLSQEERQLIIKEHLTERHARALLKIEPSHYRLPILKQIIEKGLNVSETEQLIDKLLSVTPHQSSQKFIPIIKDVRIFINTVEHAIELMRSSGINALSEHKEIDGYIEYYIRIPSEQMKKKAAD